MVTNIKKEGKDGLRQFRKFINDLTSKKEKGVLNSF